LAQHLDLHRTWSGIVYRGTRTEFAGDDDFLSGDGSLFHGGRWNAPEVCRAVYTSLEHTTVVEEASAGARQFGILDALPMTIRAVRCGLHLVVDFTTEAAPAALALDLAAVMAEEWRARNREGSEALSQALGYACDSVGLEGMVVPSALGSSSNLVIFPDNLKRHSRLTLDPRR
jgi:RES domain-containing protein